METLKAQCSVIVLQWDKHSVSWKAPESVCNQPAVMQGFTNTADCSVTVSGSMQQELPPVDVSWGSWHAKAEGGCYRPAFHWGDFSTSVWDIKLFFKGAWLCWGTLTTWLGSRGSAFLHGGGGGRNLVERSLLVNEPAVTCPQDQVQKAKNLQKHMKTQVMTLKCKTWEKEDRKQLCHISKEPWAKLLP